MSVSAPRATGLRNPATKFFKYKGGEEQGWFETYNKDTKENEIVDLRDFVILDKDLFSITGFVNKTQASIISNEVRTMDDIITVKAWKDKKSEVVLQGSYKSLKETVKDNPAYKYTKSIYILWHGELCHLSLSGATFKSWIDGVESNANHEKCFISVVGHESGKQGAVKFHFAKFGVGEEIDTKTWDKMIEVDSKILQPYLEVYLKGNGSSTTGSAPTEYHQESEGFDTSNWREVKTLDGSPLGGLRYDAILELNQALIEDGKENSELYSNVGQAIYDYQDIAKTWKDKKNKEGVYLKDLKFEDVSSMLDKIPATHKARQLIEIAYDNLKPVATKASLADFDDNDDSIPF